MLQAGARLEPDLAAVTHGELIEVQNLAIRMEDAPPASPDDATRLARQLMGSYRARDFVDTDTFALALAATFTSAPAEIGAFVVHPVLGLPARLVFPPAVAEVKAELERVQARVKSAGRCATRLLEARK